jgi:hypothetical protein
VYCTLRCTFVVYALSLSYYESKGFWRFSLIHKRRLSNEKIQYMYCTVSCILSVDDRTIKIMLFHQSAAQAMRKRVIVTYFTRKIIRTYLHLTCNKKILVVKNILAYCGYLPTSPFFFLLSEHKCCDSAATNSNSKNARSRMVASLRRSEGTGTKEDELTLTLLTWRIWWAPSNASKWQMGFNLAFKWLSTGRLWAAGFHHVSAHSRLARFFKLMNRLFL